MAEPLLIFPCNGNALEALDGLGERWELLGFVDDDPKRQGSGPGGYPVYAREALARLAHARVLAVPGSPTSFRARRVVIEELGVDPERFAQVIHPSACVSPRAQVGRNVLVMAGTVISGGASVGDHVCILPNSVIHHDASVGDWTLVGSCVVVAGGTRIGRNCYIGSGTTVMNGLTVGDEALVGLASAVIRDVAPRAKVAGHPARVLEVAPSTPQTGA
jgi:sugar O-acyltransferase (sialic acid O-acetyltransferase NeuD family)